MGRERHSRASWHQAGDSAWTSSVSAIDRSRLNSVQQYVLNHPAADLSVEALAKIAAMSVRNFTRVFTEELGIPPSEYVDLTRIDVARYLIEGSRLTIDTIATKSGAVGALPLNAGI